MVAAGINCSQTLTNGTVSRFDGPVANFPRTLCV